NKMHLGGAGIGEADVNAARHQGPHQTFRTVHRSTPVRNASLDQLKINHPPRLSSKVPGALLPSPNYQTSLGGAKRPSIPVASGLLRGACDRRAFARPVGSQ